MSKFHKYQTQIKDEAALVAALQEMGYHPEVGKDLPLYGFRGDRRAETADVVVRRREIGGMPNDVGFKRGEDGTYEAVVSEYDMRFGFRWQQRKAEVLRRYQTAVAILRLKRAGVPYAVQQQPGGGVRIVAKMAG